MLYWLPPILWMGVIFWFSTDTFSGGHTESSLELLLRAIGLSVEPAVLEHVNFLIRKTAHLAAYAILGLLLFRAFRSRNVQRWRLKWAVSAFLIAAAYALLDEYHQSLTQERTASLADSVLDMVGSLGALVWIRISSLTRSVRGPTT
jgi:VanZ family protein